ncbi:PipA/GogA/GtgA family type III secretion system effector [Salmonella enterica subsp. enterica serovar Weltevreden]|uniref:PipA/GogA/GtgA family type III secretion system effector n=4 Tax=Salmonella enterica TaxID=28901 RepID=A0A3T5HFY2_SALET|nr:PipA/GogA/GtgA family type III secretion system effector [Salmonella enterica]EAB7401015.1 PipA/GogA/GtgA family type III secretion system effector [Salmonella enterica subsp. enterica serovar Typhimurium]EBY7662346.1 PipA/GogA/GtgA family type III secretion system effector [Salmonella enterica subsp. enterica serovar Potsdam]EDE9292724.1 PipA/GogA/GtgA family type III secretion system effector [Salmonella enterica subsp. enterica serovar Rubislaw]EDQ5037375.1 PipA/GogA/GtgA family type III 
MIPGAYRVLSQGVASTSGLNTADNPDFPDIQEHAENPSQLRLAYDKLAINSEFRLEPEYVVEYLISGAGGIDPDTEIDDDTYDECHHELSRILQNAYAQSGTFRRLMNYAYEKELYDVEQRWLLGAGEAFETTVTPEDLTLSEGRKVICLNLDDTDDSSTEYYESNDGPQPFDTERSFIHEVIHALTHLQDEEKNHPRGPVVEYTNIILKEIGHPSPPRMAYIFDK